MAKLNRRQLITIFSALYLAILTAIAAYALHQTNHYSLPIPNVLSALTVALPPLAGIALESIVSFQHQLATKGKLQTSKIFQAVNVAFIVYETVLATLAGTHIAPLGGLWCPLHDKWQELYKSKDATNIQRIQDAFSCCGFNGPKDMAWPFPDKTHGSETCMVRFERDTSCLEPWRSTERKIAIMLLVVPVAVFLWKVALFLAPGFDAPWLPSAIRLPNDNSEGEVRPRPAITYHDLEDGADDDSLRDEVNRLNKDSNLATHIEGGRIRPSPLIQETENNMWSRE